MQKRPERRNDLLVDSWRGSMMFDVFQMFDMFVAEDGILVNLDGSICFVTES